MRTPAFLVAVIALLVAGCATADRYDAAGDVHALLVAVRDDDRATFERHIDRPALRRQIEARLAADARATAGSDGLAALGMALAGPGAALAEAMLVQPSVLRRAAESYGYAPDRPLPGRMAIAGALRRLDDGRVCATRRKGGECLLIFTEQDGVWRLSGFTGDLSDLRKGLSTGKGRP